MNLSSLNDLYRHMEWADAAVWDAALGCDNAREDERLRNLFHHLHLVQRAYLRAWHGEPHETPYPIFDDAKSLMMWRRSCYGEISDYLGTVTDEQLSKPFQIPWTDIVEQELGRAPGPITLAEMMLQVALHSLYHRGQINLRLREVGGQPPKVDYVVWVWLGRPAANWTSAPWLSSDPIKGELT
jgi:uncharacterized damage-inducible protein DinB